MHYTAGSVQLCSGDPGSRRTSSRTGPRCHGPTQPAAAQPPPISPREGTHVRAGRPRPKDHTSAPPCVAHRCCCARATLVAGVAKMLACRAPPAWPARPQRRRQRGTAAPGHLQGRHDSIQAQGTLHAPAPSTPTWATARTALERSPSYHPARAPHTRGGRSSDTVSPTAPAQRPAAAISALIRCSVPRYLHAAHACSRRWTEAPAAQTQPRLPAHLARKRPLRSNAATWRWARAYAPIFAPLP